MRSSVAGVAVFFAPGGVPLWRYSPGGILRPDEPAGRWGRRPLCTSRGDRREDIFIDDADRARLLAVVAQGMASFDAQVLAYCLMGNHYHFVLHTRQGNLSALMRHLNGVYTQAFNRRLVGRMQQAALPPAQRSSMRSLADWLAACGSREEALRCACTESGPTMTAMAAELGLTVARVSQLMARAERRQTEAARPVSAD